MAEFTNIELRAARESRKMPRWELAGKIGVSEDTIERWETGKQEPGPDDVGNIARALKMLEIWHRWMLSHYDSYRERYIDIPSLDHPLIDSVRIKHAMDALAAMYEELENDLMDGNIDNRALREAYEKQLRWLVAAMQQMLDKLTKMK